MLGGQCPSLASSLILGHRSWKEDADGPKVKVLPNQVGMGEHLCSLSSLLFLQSTPWQSLPPFRGTCFPGVEDGMQESSRICSPSSFRNTDTSSGWGKFGPSETSLRPLVTLVDFTPGARIVQAEMSLLHLPTPPYPHHSCPPHLLTSSGG